ncbi:MAG: CesT family type III secretion system chaperone [Chlamydiales bacterium]|nr:CesT family type III secretion system chaperone [Chlamydiales bacterium]
MVSNLYETLLAEIGSILGVSLFPDSNNSCLVKLKNGLRVQFEMDPHGRQFILGVDLGPVPSGQYRQTLFREALRANGMPYPRLGTLAFSQKTGHVVLFETMSPQDLNGERIAFRLFPLAEKALKWKDAIEHGEVPLIEAPARGGLGRTMGLFGIRP